MKVVHVCLHKNGGAAAAAWRLHLALLQTGVNSWFYTLEPRGEEDPLQQWICWKEIPLPLWKRVNRYIQRQWWQWRSRKERGELATLQQSFNSLLAGLQYEMVSLPTADKNILNDPVFYDADIIHLHWVTHFIKYHEFFSQAAGKYGLCWTLHDLHPIGGLFNYNTDKLRNPQAQDLDVQVIAYKKRCMLQYGKAIAAIAPNTWMGQQVQNSPLAECFTPIEIPYAEAAIHGTEQTQEQARQQLGWETGKIVLLAVAENTQVERKQTHWFLKVAEYFPQIQFVIAGGGTSPFHNQNTFYTGYIANGQQMAQLYKAANAVVIPSAEDNLPNVMLEAFACGTPVLSFAVGGMQQYVVHGLTGFTTPQISIEGLQHLIQQFLTARLSFNTRQIQQFAQQHFNASAVAQQHVTLYRQMLAHSTS